MSRNGKKALIVGAGPAGIEAALKIGRAGYEVMLVEKETTPGGYLNKLCSTFPRWEDPQNLLQVKLEQLRAIPDIKLLTGSSVVSARRTERGFFVELAGDSSTRDTGIEVAAVVLATGFDYYDVRRYGEYGYGVYPGVMSAPEFEARLKEWKNEPEQIEPPGAVAFIKCVGSRDRAKGYPYCSSICCMYTAKQAALVKEIFPRTACYVFYMDVRAAGSGYEEFVRSTIEDKRVRYVRGRPAKVLPEGGRLQIRVEDTLMGTPVEIEVDMVVLAGAIVPREETVRLAGLFEAHIDRYGFLASEPGQPVQAGERVFFAGGCGFPVSIKGAQEQGAAAAAEVIALFNQPG